MPILCWQCPQQNASDRFAARDKIVAASRTFEVDGTPSTVINLKQLATSGYNSDGERMTKEDYDFYIDSDCAVMEHDLTMAALHDMVVEWANYYANGEAFHGKMFINLHIFLMPLSLSRGNC